MSLAVDPKEWAKSPQGMSIIQQETLFCLGGQVWQGHQGVAVRCPESLLETNELENVADIDGTMEKVWFRRRQRLESRYTRKAKEYDERRMMLRKERSAIRESIKEDKALGIEAADDDLDQIRRINERMARLKDLAHEHEYEAAKAAEERAANQGDTPMVEEPPPEQVQCKECGMESPLGKDPGRWLRGHMMGAHRNPRKKG